MLYNFTNCRAKQINYLYIRFFFLIFFRDIYILRQKTLFKIFKIFFRVKNKEIICKHFLFNELFFGHILCHIKYNVYNIQYMTSNCHTFFKKKLQKSVTIWENLPNRYHFWTIIKQKKRKNL